MKLPTVEQLTNAGIAAALPLALFVFVKNDAVKTGAVVVLAMIAAKAVPLTASAV